MFLDALARSAGEAGPRWAEPDVGLLGAAGCGHDGAPGQGGAAADAAAGACCRCRSSGP